MAKRNTTTRRHYAFFKMETVEHYAHVLTLAKQLGNVNQLSDAQVDKLLGK